jgi:hypothetical protein
MIAAVVPPPSAIRAPLSHLAAEYIHAEQSHVPVLARAEMSTIAIYCAWLAVLCCKHHQFVQEPNCFSGVFTCETRLLSLSCVVSLCWCSFCLYSRHLWQADLSPSGYVVLHLMYQHIRRSVRANTSWCAAQATFHGNPCSSLCQSFVPGSKGYKSPAHVR